MSGRRLAVAAALAVAAVPLLVALGRWERSSNVDEQVRGLREVRSAIGPLDSPSLSAYRVSCVTRPSAEACPTANMDCLAYRRGIDPLALELCVDPAGRVVEAFDRRGGRTRIYSLRYEPAASPLRVDVRELRRILERIDAFRPLITSFEPKRGSVGTVVTITGRGFEDLVRVTFNGVRARRVRVLSATKLEAVVPPRARTGNLEVFNTSGSWFTDDPFVVTRG